MLSNPAGQSRGNTLNADRSVSMLPVAAAVCSEMRGAPSVPHDVAVPKSEKFVFGNFGDAAVVSAVNLSIVLVGVSAVLAAQSLPPKFGRFGGNGRRRTRG